ncbi:hypothetical protein SH528x_002585 [Novipirellula sp. SH528]|uniref:hypothetical protein n=1 Tax=Novipirellula sp. SH528 TaxID=3454466 RepID=UPI003FA05836
MNASTGISHGSVDTCGSHPSFDFLTSHFLTFSSAIRRWCCGNSLHLCHGTVTPIDTAIEVKHISEKGEARLENERLKNVIAKTKQAAFRLGTLRWGKPQHNFTQPLIPNFGHSLLQSCDAITKDAVSLLTKKEF